MRDFIKKNEKSFRGVGLSSVSIRKRILYSYLIIILMALFVLGIYSSLQTEKRIRTNLDDSVDIVLHNKRANIEDEVEKCNIALMSMVRNSTVYNAVRRGYVYSDRDVFWAGMKDIIEPTVTSFVNSNQYIDGITIYADYTDPEVGYILLKETHVRDADWYKELLTKYGVKWFCRDGQVFAACDYRNIWSVSDEARSERCGIIVLRVNKQLFMQGENSENYLFRVMTCDNTEVFSNTQEEVYEKDEKTALVGNKKFVRRSAELSGTRQWKLEVLVPYGSIYEGIGEIWIATLLIMLLCLALTAILGSRLSYNMTENILELNRSMDEIGKGNLDTEINVYSDDEIGVIAERMRDMLSWLNDTVDRLYKTEIEKKKYELDILRTQINPHFLYNVLSAVKWTAIEENADKTSKLVTMLSKYYRTGLNNGEETIAFEDELKNVEAYIDMEKIIKNNCFDAVYDIDEEIYNYNCITFILQPIVENAIFHGLKPRRSKDGRIVITAKAEEDITVTVTDNGIGMSEEKCRGILEGTGGGYGLSNIQRRIKLMCGEKYGLSIKSGEQGTAVTIHIPKDIEPPKNSGRVKKP